MPLFEGIEEFANVSVGLQWAIFVVAALVVVVGCISVFISIWLAIKYIKYNKKMNSSNYCGGDAARKVLDDNGLQHIKVSVVGSMLFGNSYSHYFKKVRIRRRTNKKPSITSLAIGVEKAALAVMDKEGDPDMKARVRLTPLVYLGPFAFIPLLVVGVAIDLIFFNFSGAITVVAACLGLAFYVVSFVLSIMTLKTEVKAQARACEIMREENLATENEIEMMKELYKLYNIQYINDIVLEFLQMLLKILEIVAKLQGHSSASTSSSD